MIVTISKIAVLSILAASVLTPWFADAASDPVVEISEGKILGHILQSRNKSDFYAFRQIPFAAPPVGDLRFAEPVNPKPYNGILNATANTKVCFQSGEGMAIGNGTESEDCLYLNVFTPVQPGAIDKLLPVLFWIHGGAFSVGSIGNYGPEWLIDYDVVVVTTQYRLGPLGFASTMDGVIPGNLGLKDQRKALRWVQSNIKAFGGDPERVTITGESAGAVSISYLLLDPNSEGLFSAAIQESGSAIMSNTYNADARNQTFELAKYLNENISLNDSSELLKLLRDANAEDIMAAGNKVPPGPAAGFISVRPFVPVIEEKNNLGNEYLITAPMLESFLSGNFSQVPILLGFNSEESIAWLSLFANISSNAVEFDANYSRLIDDRLNVAAEDLETMGKQLKEIYTNSTFEKDLGAYVRYTSDVGFTNAIFKQAQCTSQRVPTYLYKFSYAGDLANIIGRVDVPGAENVGHGEEMFYLWDLGYLYANSRADTDLEISNKMLTMWTNFVKYHNPTPESDAVLNNILWPPTTSSDLTYLNINSTFDVQSHPRNYDQVIELKEKYVRPPLVVV